MFGAVSRPATAVAGASVEVAAAMLWDVVFTLDCAAAQDFGRGGTDLDDVLRWRYWSFTLIANRISWWGLPRRRLV